MAHYQLSVAFHWDSADVPAERTHAIAAARLGTALPPRERALIAGRVASTSGDDPRACSTLGALVARDSFDVDALYGMGECEYHGGLSAPEPIDSLHARFRGNWNVALALFRRVLRLDPAYHPAFAHVLDILLRGQVTICQSYTTGCGNDPSAWAAIVVRDGDTLLIQPVRDTLVFGQRRLAERTRSRYRNLRAAQAIAMEWVDAGPAEARARVGLAEVDMMLGVIDSADVELRQVDARSDAFSRRNALIDRFDINVVLGRGAVARAVLDSLRHEAPAELVLRGALGVRAAAVGQLRAVATTIEAFAAEQGWTPERTRYVLAFPRSMIGVPDPNLNVLERQYWSTLPRDTLCAAGLPKCPSTALLPSLAYAVRFPRTWWPPLPTREAGFRVMPARARYLGDTLLMRRAQVYLDSLSRARFASSADEQLTSVIGADAALSLLDSATALAMARHFTDSVMPAIARTSSGFAFVDGWSVIATPRMMLLRADLAASMGHPDEARVWYAKVLDLWSEADPEFQPTVSRIRAALAIQR